MRQQAVVEYLHIIVWGLSGMFAGRLVDHICGKIKSRFTKYSWPIETVSQVVNVFCQLMLVAALPVVLTLLEMQSFVMDWQVSVAGLFFAAFYLGMQSNLLTTAQSIK